MRAFSEVVSDLNQVMRQPPKQIVAAGEWIAKLRSLLAEAKRAERREKRAR